MKLASVETAISVLLAVEPEETEEQQERNRGK
jgi:hypothetical protein